ncbi:hypothetical protein [Bradyrhizobium sp. USDA 4470]
MDDQLTSILRRYSHGEISAERAADEMGAAYNVADVYVLSREAGLPLPDPDGPFERAQFERARDRSRKTQIERETTDIPMDNVRTVGRRKPRPIGLFGPTADEVKASMDLAKLAPRVAPKGVHRYRSHAEANVEADRWAAEGMAMRARESENACRSKAGPTRSAILAFRLAWRWLCPCGRRVR